MARGKTSGPNRRSHLFFRELESGEGAFEISSVPRVHPYVKRAPQPAKNRQEPDLSGRMPAREPEPDRPMQKSRSQHPVRNDLGQGITQTVTRHEIGPMTEGQTLLTLRVRTEGEASRRSWEPDPLRLEG